jgi:hypothetical protein
MESFDLPISGMPSLYPFDHYQLILATTIAGGNDGASAFPTEMNDALAITIDSDAPRFVMVRPQEMTDRATTGDPRETYERVVALRFARPLHLWVLTCLLVGFIAAAAVLTVITEPLHRLLVGIGSLVLGVWGVRSILASDAPPLITALDLLLSGVILIVLYGVAIRFFLALRREDWDAVVRSIRGD